MVIARMLVLCGVMLLIYKLYESSRGVRRTREVRWPPWTDAG